jgi:DNA-binding transcriptional LysR family regulator
VSSFNIFGLLSVGIAHSGRFFVLALVLPRGTGLRASLDDACAIAGFRPRVAFEASNLNVLVQLAGRGLGVAIVPESVARAHSNAIDALAITRPQLLGRLELA